MCLHRSVNESSVQTNEVGVEDRAVQSMKTKNEKVGQSDVLILLYRKHY